MYIISHVSHNKKKMSKSIFNLSAKKKLFCLTKASTKRYCRMFTF